MKKMLLIVSFLIIGAAFGTQAHAQAVDTTAPKERFPNMSHVFESLPPDMQEELLVESARAKAICQSHTLLAVYQDCECIGMKFLDARLSIGPDMSINNIIIEVSRECTNTPAIAGYQYTRCMPRTKQLFPTAPEKDVETYCHCVGNAVARDYAQNPHNSISYQTQLLVGAQVECGRGQFMRQQRIERDRAAAQERNVLP